MAVPVYSITATAARNKLTENFEIKRPKTN
jgi:hypothetical protein